MLKYRQNVAAILIDKNDQILIAERIDKPGAWQFPQGGVDAGEEHDDAVLREVEEELAIRPKFYHIERKKCGYRYEFPKSSKRYGKFLGQEQCYYLCRVEKEGKKEVSVDTKHPEFRKLRWIEPAEFRLDWLPEFKRKVYRQVMEDFFAVRLK